MKYVLSIPALMFAGLVFLASAAQLHASDITVPPDNPDDVERLRVWIPMEQNVSCHVVVQVLGHRGKSIRTLFDGMLGKGYHNFYWDKKDDSGEYVEAGKYATLISACGEGRYETLEVVYRPWENTSHIAVEESESIDTAIVTLDEDSARVSLVMATARGDTALVIVTDTLLPAGRFLYPIMPPTIVPGGFYDIQLYIDGALVKSARFNYRP